MRLCVSHRSGIRAKAMPSACFLEWNMFMLDTGNLASCHQQRITGNYPISKGFRYKYYVTDVGKIISMLETCTEK